VRRLNEDKGFPIAELHFLREGLDEVVKARKILAWTYVFGYYL